MGEKDMFELAMMLLLQTCLMMTRIINNAVVFYNDLGEVSGEVEQVGGAGEERDVGEEEGRVQETFGGEASPNGVYVGRGERRF